MRVSGDGGGEVDVEEDARVGGFFGTLDPRQLAQLP